MVKGEIGISTIYERDLTFYKEFINKIKIPILLVDEHGKIIYANRAASLVTGYTEEELMQMHFNDLFELPDSDAEYNDFFDKIKEIGKIEGRIKLKHQESPKIEANIKMYNFRPDNRRHHYYQVILRDFYADHELDTLRRPLLDITKQLQVFNDKLEKHVQELTKNAGISPSSDK